jgi:hypothetical protein
MTRLQAPLAYRGSRDVMIGPSLICSITDRMRVWRQQPLPLHNSLLLIIVEPCLGAAVRETIEERNPESLQGLSGSPMALVH